jgi:hypothetical protein
MIRTTIALGLFAMALIAASPGAAAAQGGAAATAKPAPPPPAVKVGEPMPDFTLTYLEPARDGGQPQRRTTKLSDYAGKQVVVLAFFPAAFSPG